MSSSPARSVYIASPEGHTGKSVVALGLGRPTDAPGAERRGVPSRHPSTTGDDQVVEVALDHGASTSAYESCVGVTYEDVHADPDAALATIVERYRVIERDLRSRGRRRIRLHRCRRSDRARVQCPCRHQSGRTRAARRERVRADTRRCRPTRRDRHRRARPSACNHGRRDRQPVRSGRSSTRSATGCPSSAGPRGRCRRPRCCRHPSSPT